MVTVASGTTALLGSVTTPVMVPMEVVCAHTGSAAQQSSTAVITDN